MKLERIAPTVAPGAGDPVVSVLTTTYNHAAYVRQCIESVQAQSYRNWEMIVLDDGSKDETARVASAAASRDPRVSVYRRENAGPEALSSLYNHGLHLARGRMIAILEGDDWWPPEKLRIQLDAWRSDVILSFGKCRIVGPDGATIRIHRPEGEPDVLENRPLGSALKALGRQRNFIPAVTCMIRREVLQSIGGFVGGFSMLQVDFPTWARLSLVGPFQYVDQELGVWRRIPSSLTSTRLSDMIRGRESYLRSLFDSHLASTASSAMRREWLQSPSNAEILVQEARVALSFGEFERARALACDAVRSDPSLRIRLRALLGLLSGMVKRDLFESFSRFRRAIGTG